MQDTKYTDSHEWIHCAGPTSGRVGITAHAQKELGEVVYIELPKIGQKVKSGEAVCVIESTKAATDVYAPISGTVIAINEVLTKNPHALNDDPEGAGWLFQIQFISSKEQDRLLSLEEYRALI
ncbi:MAG: glycine cleavage system protein GcvH [Chlamydiae bacterium]|nr:glycine cleavage system protein GcvH [Chlamydiota bacterium]